MRSLYFIIATLAIVIPIAPALAADDAAPSKSVPIVIHRLAASKVAAQLDKRVAFEFQATPLNDVIDFIRDYTGVSVILDANGLDIAGVSAEEPVTLSLNDVPLRLALDLLLAPLELEALDMGDVLMITDKEETAAKPLTRVYPAIDLLLASKKEGEHQWLIEETMEMIQTTVEPDNWEVNGGTSTIALAPTTGSLVVRAPARVHRLIEELLVDIRESTAAAEALSARAKLSGLAELQATLGERLEQQRLANRAERRPPSPSQRAEEAQALEAERRAEIAKLELERAKFEWEQMQKGASKQPVSKEKDDSEK